MLLHLLLLLLMVLLLHSEMLVHLLLLLLVLSMLLQTSGRGLRSRQEISRCWHLLRLDAIATVHAHAVPVRSWSRTGHW